jgi:DNA-binding IclR family transcriptional regulator
VFNVSRSVDRVFELLEMFKVHRRPMTATEIRLALDIPHSSSIVMLARLVELGYLEVDTGTKKYFPSASLARLCGWITTAENESNPLARLVHAIYEQTGETTSLSRRAGLFSMPVLARMAEHPEGVEVRAGISGGLLTLTVVGRTLLSTLPDPEIAEVVRYTNSWARHNRVGVHHDLDTIMNTVRHVRTQGYLFNCNVLLPNVGAVSAPVHVPGEDGPLAVTVCGSTRRIEQQGHRLVQIVQREIARFRAEQGPAVPVQPPKATSGRGAVVRTATVRRPARTDAKPALRPARRTTLGVASV